MILTKTPPALDAQDMQQATRFLERLSGGKVEETQFFFQTFDDGPKARPHLAQVLQGTLATVWPQLSRMQAKGAGAFVTIAETDSGRKKVDWRRARTVWQEDDKGNEQMLPLEPHIVVESSPGKRHQYILTSTANVDEWDAVQGKMVTLYGSDPNAKDRTRVLRLPGTWHQKDPKEPSKVRLIKIGDHAPFPWDQVKAAFGVTEQTTPALPARTKVTGTRQDDGVFIEQLMTGSNYHESVLILTARYRARGMSEHDVVQTIRGLMNANGDKSPRWQARYADIERTARGAFDKFPIAKFEDIAHRIKIGELTNGGSPLDTARDVLGMLATSDLSRSNEESLLKMLKVNSGISLKALREDLGRLRRQSGGDVKFNADHPVEIAQALINEEFSAQGATTIRRWQQMFYLWDGVRYEPAIDEDVRARIYGFLQRQGVTIVGRSIVDNTADALKAEANIAATNVTPSWTGVDAPAPANEIIACRNGLLHPATRILHPHTPQFFNINSLEIDFDPAAAEPRRWLRFLNEVLPDDQESIDTLQEWFGYCLTHDTSQQKALIAVGPKRSGKGTVARVLQRILGEFNVCGPTLASLAKEFGLQPLIGRLLAIVSDARLSGTSDVQGICEAILRITGEDLVSVPRKHLSDWAGKLDLRFMLMTNVLPGIVDAGGAIASRFIILSFSQSFYGKEDPELTPKLLSELPGILNWALGGLDRLKKRGVFVQPSSGEAAMRDLVRKTVPVLAFAQDMFEPEHVPSAWIGKDSLFALYQTWRENQGLTFKLSKDRLFEELYNADARFASFRPLVADGAGSKRRVQAVCGARLREDVADRQVYLTGDETGVGPGVP